MPDQKPSKFIIDTNLWISFLIGKELHDLKDLIVYEQIQRSQLKVIINEKTLRVRPPRGLRV